MRRYIRCKILQRANPHGFGHERTPQKRPTIVSATHRMQFTRRCHDEYSLDDDLSCLT